MFVDNEKVFRMKENQYTGLFDNASKNSNGFASRVFNIIPTKKKNQRNRKASLRHQNFETKPLGTIEFFHQGTMTDKRGETQDSASVWVARKR